MRLVRVAPAVVGLLIAHAALAQTGGLVGSVARDSAGHMIGGAEIRIPQLNRVATSNYLGEFRVDGLAPGKYVVNVRSVGFTPFVDTIDVGAGKFVEREWILSQTPVTLEGARTTAAGKAFKSPALAGFEERRLGRASGQFVSDSALRQNDNSKLQDVLGRVAGLTRVQEGSATYLASGRSQDDGGQALSGKKSNNPTWCFVTVFIDGIKTFVGPRTVGNPPPDVNLLNVNQFSGIEYYSGGAQIPPQFNGTGSSCGTILLWTRER